MGIYNRYSAAFLILFVSLSVDASTRKTVSVPTKESVIKGSGTSFQTPSGEAAYYGQDIVDEHTAGNRFKPGDSVPSGTPAKQKVTVKPVVTVNPKKAASAMIKGMRGGVPGVVASAAASVIIDALDGVIDNGVVKVPSVSEVPVNTSPEQYYWSWGQTTPRFSNYVSACQALASSSSGPISTFEYASSDPISPQSVKCFFHWYDAGRYRGVTNKPYSTAFNVSRYGTMCPTSSTYDSSTGSCVTSTGLTSPSEAQWKVAEDFASAQNSDFIRDMTKAACEGSTSPARCYDELADYGNLQGPASQSSTPQTTTTTTKRPDGTTSVTTSTTTNKYNYSFGPNYYNYSTTTKTVTTTDGITTETETVDSTPIDSPTDEDQPDYTYSDSEFPEVPSFYDQKYPDGISGVWNDVKTRIDQSAFMQFLKGFIPSFSGSCPSFSIPLNFAGLGDYGTHALDSGIVCHSLDFAKVIILFTAVLTFRALVFGG